MTDFYKMSSMMKDLFPSTPEQDKQALLNMANNAPADIPPTKDYINESTSVPEGSMPLGIDSVSDFAKLAGVTETQKTGSAGQAKGKDPMPKLSKPTAGNETPHPLKDKLVGEDDIDITALTPAATTLGGAIDPDMDPSALIARGLKKAGEGEILNDKEREAIQPYIALFSELMSNPAFRNNLIAMQKILAKKNKKKEEDAPPGREKQVKKLKKKFDDPGAPYAIAWAQHNKNGKPNKKTESIKEELYKALAKYKK
jgi:hypothetical protein|tara:strand:- start:265 stop:1032 length:768 start_codon:yes stop_codon:yes gene_type:complete